MSNFRYSAAGTSTLYPGSVRIEESLPGLVQDEDFCHSDRYPDRLSAIPVEEFVNPAGNPVGAQVVGVAGDAQLLEVLLVFDEFGDDLQGGSRRKCRIRIGLQEHPDG